MAYETFDQFTMDQCEIARTFAEDDWLLAALVAQLALTILVVVLAPIVLTKKKWREKAIHSNLKVTSVTWHSLFL